MSDNTNSGDSGTRTFHWEAVFWIVIGILVMGLPSLGIFSAKSVLWNVVWWILWIGYMLVFVMRERFTSSAAGIFLLDVISVAYLEVAPTGRSWAYIVALLVIPILVITYREKCKNLCLESLPPDRTP